MEYREFRDYGPVPWWSWSGVLEKDEMIRQLDFLKSIGIDEFFIFVVFGSEKPVFLSEEYFDYVKFTIEEVEKRNMHLWIYDDLNWPSGTAGGHLPQQYPDYRLCGMVRTKFELPPDQTYSFGIGDPVRVFIRDTEDEPWRIIQLKNNFFYNDTDHTIYFQVFSKEIFNYPPLTSRGTAWTWDQRGMCDLLNPDAVKAWMGLVHERYYEKFGDKFGTTIRGFFYDEPHCKPNYPDLPWTKDLDKKFMDRYGYNYLDMLPAFYEYTENSTQVRYDFWSLISELVSESFGKTLARWCEDHGVLSTGHCVYEEIRDQIHRLTFNGEIHGILKHMQIPGMDLLCDNTPYELTRAYRWYGYTADVAPAFLFTAKQVTSTGRFSGAKRIMAEANGVCNWDEGLNREKMVYDWISACGVNMLNENGLLYTMKGFLKRAASNTHCTQPWMKYYHIYSDYCRIMSRFATGELQTNVAVLTPEDTIRSGTIITDNGKVDDKYRIADAMVPIMDKLMRGHVDFELIFHDILNAGNVVKGALEVPNMTVKAIILPLARILSKETVAKLREFISAGGTVICVGCRPEMLTDGSALDFSDIPLVDAAELPALLKEKLGGLPYGFEGEKHEEIFSALREKDGVKTLFMVNMGKEPMTVKVTPSPDGAAAYTPGDDVKWTYSGDTVTLEPEQSVLLEYGVKADGQMPTTWIPAGETIAEFDKAWDYELDTPNSAACCFEIGPTYKKCEPDEVRLYIPVTRDYGHDMEFSPNEYPYFWLRGKFTVEDADIIKGMKLIFERGIYEEIRINGVKITTPETQNILWDYVCVQREIADAVKVGENTIEMLGLTTMDNLPSRSTRIFAMSFIEPVLLHGNFAARYDGRETALCKLPEKLVFGPIEDQGFPHYSGDITISCKFDRDAAENCRVQISDGFYMAAKVSVNGSDIPARVWRPYLFPAALKAGENSLSIRLSGHIGTIIRRAYGGRRIDIRSLNIGKIKLVK